MEIDQLIALVTKQVRERLEAFEKRKKVLLLGSCEGDSMEGLCSMFESNGFSLCDVETYKKEQDIENYEYIVIPKGKFGELLERVKLEDDNSGKGEALCGQVECTPAAEAEKSCRLDKRVITEQDMQRLARGGCREIKLSKKAIITPLALDSAKVFGIRIVKE